MADIDKALPNEVRKTIEIEGAENAAEENLEIQEELPNVGEILNQEPSTRLKRKITTTT